MPSEGLPYPIFTYAALLPWQLFSIGLTKATTSLVNNQPLLTKVYFPRLILPLSAVMGGLVDFSCAFVVFLGMMFYYGIFPGAAALLLPLFLLFTMTISLAVGLWLSALNVEYRDVGQAISFLIQIWLFATPIVYPSSLVPRPWRTLLGLNPMTGVVEGFRWALLGKGEVTGPLMLVSILSVCILLFGGLMFFRRMEKTFADYI
jgi:lipopolysaccharide transport system permease protein